MAEDLWKKYCDALEAFRIAEKEWKAAYKPPSPEQQKQEDLIRLRQIRACAARLGIEPSQVLNDNIDYTHD